MLSKLGMNQLCHSRELVRKRIC